MTVEPCSARNGQGRPRLEVADIFRGAGEAYRERYVPTFEQRKVISAIEKCRTAVLGGHLDVCAKCGHQAPSYNSCRNRHCPKCQSLTQARWLEQRRERIVPTKYFHVVFTLPQELRELARANPKDTYPRQPISSSGHIMIRLAQLHHLHADHRSADVCPGRSDRPHLRVQELKNAAPGWSFHTPATSRCRFHARRRPSCHPPGSFFPHSS